MQRLGEKMKTKEEIETRMDELEKTYHELPERARMSFDGAALNLRIYELKWVLESSHKNTSIDDEDHIEYAIGMDDELNHGPY